MSAAEKIVPPIPTEEFRVAAKSRFEPAGNNQRVIAFIIDLMIAGVGQQLLIAMLTGGLHLNRIFGSLLGQAVIYTSYWIGLTLYFGATPGKKIMGIRIVNVDHNTKLGVGQLFLREYVGRVVSMVPLFLGYVWVSFDRKERKAFHDMLAKTRVVKYR